MEIGNEIISTVIFLPSPVQEGLLSVTSESMVNRLVKLTPEKGVVRWTDCLDMTTAVDWDVKHQQVFQYIYCSNSKNESLSTGKR